MNQKDKQHKHHSEKPGTHAAATADGNTEETPLKEVENGKCNLEESQAKQARQVKLEELQRQVEKYQSDFLYLRADFDNYKKQAIKERAEYIRYGSERLIVEVLGILDNLERALELKVTEENLQDFVKGVAMTSGELRSVLNKFGVTEILSKGQPFDPLYHEALGSEESKDLPPGHILRVFKKPYKLYERLVRPGQVVVVK